MAVDNRDGLIQPSQKVIDWLRYESAYQWNKYPVKEETVELLRGGLGANSYWGGFFGARWSRFQLVDKVVNPLRASQDLLKETATAIGIGVCLRYAKGLVFQEANEAAISAAGKASSEYTTSDIDRVLSVTGYQDTPMFSQAEKASDILIREKASRMDEVILIMDGIAQFEASLSDRYIKIDGKNEFPTPGVSSSEDVTPWS